MTTAAGTAAYPFVGTRTDGATGPRGKSFSEGAQSVLGAIEGGINGVTGGATVGSLGALTGVLAGVVVGFAALNAGGIIVGGLLALIAVPAAAISATAIWGTMGTIIGSAGGWGINRTAGWLRGILEAMSRGAASTPGGTTARNAASARASQAGQDGFETQPAHQTSSPVTVVVTPVDVTDAARAPSTTRTRPDPVISPGVIDGDVIE